MWTQPDGRPHELARSAPTQLPPVAPTAPSGGYPNTDKWYNRTGPVVAAAIGAVLALALLSGIRKHHRGN